MKCSHLGWINRKVHKRKIQYIRVRRLLVYIRKMAEEGAAAPNLRQGQDNEAGQRHLHINWSNFKPEFSGKPEEDAEAHLPHSNDWINGHHFNNDVKVQRFCLTLLGETRLWYHSLEPLRETTWAQLQNLFRQRYSKIR